MLRYLPVAAVCFSATGVALQLYNTATVVQPLSREVLHLRGDVALLQQQLALATGQPVPSLPRTHMHSAAQPDMLERFVEQQSEDLPVFLRLGALLFSNRTFASAQPSAPLLPANSTK